MESILAIACIFFFAVLTYALIQGHNLTKFHKYNCHTLYIPENLNLDQAFQSVDNLSLDALKKKARIQGASREFVDKYKDEDDKKYLKSFIIQKVISDENILFTDITEDSATRDNIVKREYCRSLTRENKTDVTCPTNPNSLVDYSNVILPTPTNKLEEEHVLLKYEFMSPDDIIDYMKKDQEDYEDKQYSFLV